MQKNEKKRFFSQILRKITNQSRFRTNSKEESEKSEKNKAKADSFFFFRGVWRAKCEKYTDLTKENISVFTKKSQKGLK